MAKKTNKKSNGISKPAVVDGKEAKGKEAQAVAEELPKEETPA